MECQPAEYKAQLIEKIVVAVERGLECESINDNKYKLDQKEWSSNTHPFDTSDVVQEKTGTTTESHPVKFPALFLSYSHEDKFFKEELDKHLTALKRSKKLSYWHDKEIGGGTNWDKIIKENLQKADFILLLISPDFLNSEYIWEVELERAFKLQNEGKVAIIPIFLTKVDFEGLPFEKLQGYPEDGKPITSFSEREQPEAFFQVARGIRNDVDRWIKSHN